MGVLFVCVWSSGTCTQVCTLTKGAQSESDAGGGVGVGGPSYLV